MKKYIDKIIIEAISSLSKLPAELKRIVVFFIIIALFGVFVISKINGAANNDIIIGNNCDFEEADIQKDEVRIAPDNLSVSDSLENLIKGTDVVPKGLSVGNTEMNNFMQGNDNICYDEDNVYFYYEHFDMENDRKVNEQYIPYIINRNTGRIAVENADGNHIFYRWSPIILENTAFFDKGVIRPLNSDGREYNIKAKTIVNGEEQTTFYSEAGIIPYKDYLYECSPGFMQGRFMYRVRIDDLIEDTMGAGADIDNHLHCTTLKSSSGEFLFEMNGTRTFGIYGDYMVLSGQNIYSYNLQNGVLLLLVSEEDYDPSAAVVSDGEYIFFSNAKNSCIEKISFDGSEREVILSDINCGHLNCSDNKLFYTVCLYDRDKGSWYDLYCLDLKENSILLLCSLTNPFKDSNTINLIDDWVYFTKSHNELWRVKMDGSKNECLVGSGT